MPMDDGSAALLQSRFWSTHDIFVDGVVLAWLCLVQEVMRCAVDAEHKFLLERPGCYITRELRVSGLVASAKESGLGELRRGTGSTHDGSGLFA